MWREIEEFDLLRTMIEHSARAAGIELDLSDLDPSGAPEEFERAVRERMGAAAALFEFGWGLPDGGAEWVCIGSHADYDRLLC